MEFELVVCGEFRSTVFVPSETPTLLAVLTAIENTTGIPAYAQVLQVDGEEICQDADEDTLANTLGIISGCSVVLSHSLPDGRHPMHSSAQLGSIGALRLWLRAGTPVDVRDSAGLSPLAYAAAHSRADAVAELLASGADALARDDSGGTPLHAAFRTRGDEAVVALLCAGGASMTARDSLGRCPQDVCPTHCAM